MKISDLLCLGNQTLHKDQNKLLLATLLNKNPLELSLHLDEFVEEEFVRKYKECLENIQKGIPIQYALKETNFYGFSFYVDSRVLIPRFETEELVYYTNLFLNKYFNQDKEVKVLDLCTGSGCIGLTLKKLNKTLSVTLSDISTEALEVASINKEKLEVEASLIQSDLFSNIHTPFDVLISNPPYVSITDEVSEIVLKNEPPLALYAKNNGLEFYERILKSCESYLEKKYLIAFEIGSSQKDAVLFLIQKYLKEVSVITKKDMSGRDRMVFIFKNVNLNE